MGRVSFSIYGLEIVCTKLNITRRNEATLKKMSSINVF